MPESPVDPYALLPVDHDQACLLGRVWVPATAAHPAGPRVVHVTAERVYDITADTPTMADIINHESPVTCLAGLEGKTLSSFEDIALNTLATERQHELPFFLSPVDIQPVKASGVTFHESLVERIIEERAEGKPELALQIRNELTQKLGHELDTVRPGSAEALKLLQMLREQNLWSQYLEVGLGSDAEIFTKALPLASVGTGAEIGVLVQSLWNNPEPELSLVINNRAQIVGATLGNDVNHRDIEGRSALLLGKAKDNNSACALGPFIRLLDQGFTLENLRNLEIKLEITGKDNFSLQEENTVANIRRDILELVNQCIGPCNDFPDGVVLMLGAMTSPTRDRDEAGAGFTHKIGDIVRISSPALGLLVNRVQHTDKLKRQSFGIRDLLTCLAQQSRMN